MCGDSGERQRRRHRWWYLPQLREGAGVGVGNEHSFVTILFGMTYGLVKDLVNSQGAVSFRCVELTDPHTACCITCTIKQIVKLCSVVHRLQ